MNGTGIVGMAANNPENRVHKENLKSFKFLLPGNYENCRQIYAEFLENICSIAVVYLSIFFFFFFFEIPKSSTVSLTVYLKESDIVCITNCLIAKESRNARY